MFQRARRSLALRYVGLFIVVLAAFSIVFVFVLSQALQPAFDIGPEVSNEEAARTAFSRTIETVLAAVLIADAVAITAVAAGAYYLAGRTLRPIREAHDRQRRFVADASHEMRTPLAALRATAESGLAGTTPEREALRNVVATAGRMSALTSDLLELARSETGRIDGVRTATDFSVLVAEATASVLAGHGLGSERIDIVLAPDLMVDGDERELIRVVQNLVDNAIRYTNDASPIRIRTQARDGVAVLRVSDDGPGIGALDLARVFDPFFRVRADADAPEGTGLGLAIARELARRNGGQIEASSTPGSGATFTLRLPRFR